jgi:succinoglycan biosynthesis protein ExoO
MPFLSIVMAAYNAAPFINRAIASVQDQDFTDWELIIVDDASTDGTRDVVTSVSEQDSRVKLVCLGVNGGPSLARNEAIDRAKGEWIVILDADDAFLPGRLSRIAEGAADGCEVIADNIVFRDDMSNREVGTAFRRQDGVWNLSALDVVSSERSWPGFRMGFLKPSFKRSLLQNHAIRYNNQVRHGEDFLILVNALIFSSKSIIIGNPGYLYTQQISSSTAKKSATTRSKYNPRDRILTAMALGELTADTRNQQLAIAVRRYEERIQDLAQAMEVIQCIKQRQPGSLKSLSNLGLKPLIRFFLVNPRLKKLLKNMGLAHSIAS